MCIQTLRQSQVPNAYKDILLANQNTAQSLWSLQVSEITSQRIKIKGHVDIHQKSSTWYKNMSWSRVCFTGHYPGALLMSLWRKRKMTAFYYFYTNSSHWACLFPVTKDERKICQNIYYIKKLKTVKNNSLWWTCNEQEKLTKLVYVISVVSTSHESFYDWK